MSLKESIAPIHSHLSDDAFKALLTWARRTPQSEKDIIELVNAQDWDELEDAFYKRISVGTGGIRGKIGPGPNRINRQTIGETSQALSLFIQDFGEKMVKRGVVVGYEARKLSKEFAKLSCEVFAANGIPSYLFDDLRATPEVSFAIRHLKTAAGIQITASHNPRTENGFKFYWTYGGQVVPPLDAKFMGLVSRVKEVKQISFNEAKKRGLITIIGKEVDIAYQARIRSLSLIPSRSARVVFSPIHGAGITNVLPVLKAEGFDLTLVPEQAVPDQAFPTAVGDLINPEYEEVMRLPIMLGEKIGADLALMSDPDADRIGVAAKEQFSRPFLKFLTGNEVGAILAYFILSRLKEKNRLSPSNAVITTYVTTTLISDIAKGFGVRVVDDLLVGYKFIGATIEGLKRKSDFIFAAEESLGYLAGTFLRDKDAAIAALLVAEAASWVKDQKRTLVDYLDEIYERYGYYKNRLYTREMPGKKGFIKKQSIMERLRAKPPYALGGLKVLKVIDRLPAGDQITFLLSGDARTRVTVRPSGTEPKLKYYIQHYKKAGSSLEAVKQEVDRVAKDLEKGIVEYTK